MTVWINTKNYQKEEKRPTWVQVKLRLAACWLKKSRMEPMGCRLVHTDPLADTQSSVCSGTFLLNRSVPNEPFSFSLHWQSTCEDWLCKYLEVFISGYKEYQQPGDEPKSSRPSSWLWMSVPSPADFQPAFVTLESYTALYWPGESLQEPSSDFLFLNFVGLFVFVCFFP